MKTLFSLKGMCAFNEECGAPSPCFPIKGGGEPHFWVFTFWEGETLALPYLNPFIPPSSSRVRVRAFVVARVLASSWCSCSSSSWCSSARARWSTLCARLFWHSLSSSSLARALTSSVFSTRLTLPPPSHNIISSFFCPPYSCLSLCFARVSTFVIS